MPATQPRARALVDPVAMPLIRSAVSARIQRRPRRPPASKLCVRPCPFSAPSRGEARETYPRRRRGEKERVRSAALWAFFLSEIRRGRARSARRRTPERTVLSASASDRALTRWTARHRATDEPEERDTGSIGGKKTCLLAGHWFSALFERRRCRGTDGGARCEDRDRAGGRTAGRCATRGRARDAELDGGSNEPHGVANGGHAREGEDGRCGGMSGRGGAGGCAQSARAACREAASERRALGLHATDSPCDFASNVLSKEEERCRESGKCERQSDDNDRRWGEGAREGASESGWEEASAYERERRGLALHALDSHCDSASNVLHDV